MHRSIFLMPGALILFLSSFASTHGARLSTDHLPFNQGQRGVHIRLKKQPDLLAGIFLNMLLLLSNLLKKEWRLYHVLQKTEKSNQRIFCMMGLLCLHGCAYLIAFYLFLYQKKRHIAGMIGCLTALFLLHMGHRCLEGITLAADEEMPDLRTENWSFYLIKQDLKRYLSIVWLEVENRLHRAGQILSGPMLRLDLDLREIIKTQKTSDFSRLSKNIRTAIRQIKEKGLLPNEQHELNVLRYIFFYHSFLGNLVRWCVLCIIWFGLTSACSPLQKYRTTFFGHRFEMVWVLHLFYLNDLFEPRFYIFASSLKAYTGFERFFAVFCFPTLLGAINESIGLVFFHRSINWFWRIALGGVLVLCLELKFAYYFKCFRKSKSYIGQFSFTQDLVKLYMVWYRKCLELNRTKPEGAEKRKEAMAKIDEELTNQKKGLFRKEIGLFESSTSVFERTNNGLGKLLRESDGALGGHAGFVFIDEEDDQGKKLKRFFKYHSWERFFLRYALIFAGSVGAFALLEKLKFTRV